MKNFVTYAYGVQDTSDLEYVLELVASVGRRSVNSKKGATHKYAESREQHTETAGEQVVEVRIWGSWISRGTQFRL